MVIILFSTLYCLVACDILNIAKQEYNKERLHECPVEKGCFGAVRPGDVV
jgi:hypothetical protein